MTRTIAALLFPGFEMLDLYGPLEMFNFFTDDFAIRTVALQAGPVAASNGPDTVAQDAMGDGRRYDILLVPGGPGTRDVAQLDAYLDWLNAQAKTAEVITSVCTGAMFLACAGLLDGRRATTNKMAFDWVTGHGGDIDWQRNARWVRDGNIYTSSGVSAGIDMSLAVIEDLVGAATAAQAAKNAEYLRNPDPDNDPFALEDPDT